MEDGGLVGLYLHVPESLLVEEGVDGLGVFLLEATGSDLGFLLVDGFDLPLEDLDFGHEGGVGGLVLSVPSMGLDLSD